MPEEVVVHAARGVTDSLLQDGVLGLMTLVCLFAACFFYWEKSKTETRERLLYERYVTKNEGWVEKYNELARDMKAVIEAYTRKV